MENKKSYKNGGFPPIKYCKPDVINSNTAKNKERGFATAPNQNVNIRHLITQQKKPSLVILDADEEINVASDLN